MNEIQHLKQSFEDLFDGHPWLDITVIGTLQQLTPTQAYKRAVPNCNTIWEIVTHIIAWRKNLLERLHGVVITTPDHNYFQPVTDASDAAWQQTLDQLHATQQQWINYFEELKEDSFEKIYPNNKMTYLQHIHGIIQHDAYHLGQIVLLAKVALH